MIEDLIVEIWDTFKGHIPEKNREVAANQYVDFLLREDVPVEVLEEHMGYDPHLDDAISSVLDEEDEYFEDEEE